MIMDRPLQFNRQKLKAVVHEVCSRADPRELGKVKLHRILYFADMMTFVAKGAPLTGVEYRKQQFGPAATHLTWALRELVREGKIGVRERDYFGFRKLDFVPRRAPDLDDLADDERRLLADIADFVCGRSAREISEISHNAAWESAAIGETIPYFTAFLLAPCEVTDEDVEWGTREAQILSLS
jgi:hypothetical protein